MRGLALGMLLLLPITAGAAFDVDLKYGSKGASVTELQEFLIDQGCLSGQATGNFYSLTLKGVKCFQAANNVPTTGYFGPRSRVMANSILMADITASENDEVSQVGATSTPANTDAMSLLAQQIADLNIKLAALNAQTATTNQTLQNIQQNTTPAGAPSAPVTPVVQPAPDMTPQTLSVALAGRAGDETWFTFNSNKPFSIERLGLTVTGHYGVSIPCFIDVGGTPQRAGSRSERLSAGGGDTVVVFDSPYTSTSTPDKSSLSMRWSTAICMPDIVDRVPMSVILTNDNSVIKGANGDRIQFTDTQLVQTFTQ